MVKIRALSLLQRVYALVRGFGRTRLAVAFAMVVAQGFSQVVGVASIFPFLQIATDPAAFRGSRVAAWLPIAELSDRELLLWSGFACVGMLFASNMISLAAIVVRAHYVYGVAAYLRKGLLRDVLSQPYSFFLETNSSEIFQRIQIEVEQLVEKVLLPLLGAFASSLTVGLMLTTITVAQPMAALVAIAGVGIFYVTIFRNVRPRAGRVGEDVRVHSRSMIRTLQEALANIKTVLAFDKAHFFASRYGVASDETARLMPWVHVYVHFPKFFLEPLAVGGIVALMVAAALSDGTLAAALPSLGVMALSAYRLLPQAQGLYGELSTVATFRHVVGKLERRGFACAPAYLAGDPAEPLTFDEQITFERVSFRYPRAKNPVLCDVSVSIPKNAAVGISGPSGSGKSTFVDVLIGLHVPSTGCVRIDGHALSVEHLPGWRARVAYVPQEVHLFDDTVESNIAFGVPADQVDPVLLREVAEAAQLLHFIEHDLPDGFATVVGERGARLSGGQRQRLGLARALYRRPELLILDEATSALDTSTETMIMGALHQLHGTLTIVVIAHRTDTLNMCDMRIEFPVGFIRA
jgi:ATP-binding cassette subfamily C protein